MNAFYFLLSGGPRFADRNEHTRVTLNDRVEFTCNPISYPADVNVRWLKDGDKLDPELNRETIVFEEANYDDEGVYTCVACNKYNCNSKNFQLKVRSKVFFLFVIACTYFFIVLFRPSHTIVASHWYNHRTVPGGYYYYGA